MCYNLINIICDCYPAHIHNMAKRWRILVYALLPKQADEQICRFFFCMYFSFVWLRLLAVYTKTTTNLKHFYSYIFSISAVLTSPKYNWLIAQSRQQFWNSEMPETSSTHQKKLNKCYFSYNHSILKYTFTLELCRACCAQYMYVKYSTGKVWQWCIGIWLGRVRAGMK